jgi:hypothetical protein
VSDTTGTGAGSSVAPGWYADPNDPQQLRWWSGAAWTEHVSPKSTPVAPEAAVAAAQSVVPAAQPQVEQADQPAAAEEAPSVEQSAAEAAPVAPTVASVSAADPLPSRRALREGSVDSVAVPGAAPNAWDQASVPTAAVTTPAADVAPAQPEQPVQPAQPVQPEQFAQPVQPVQPALIEPELAQPMVGQPTVDQIAWNQAQAALASQAAQTAQAAAAIPPAQPAPAEVAQPIQSAQPANPAQNLWNQQAAAPAPDWNQPAAASAAPMDGLFAAPSAEQVAEPAVDPSTSPASGQWGLTPSTRRSRAAAAPAASTATSTSTLWVWLVAVSPIIAAALIGVAIKTSGIHFDNWMLPAAIVAPYLLVILFAAADRSRLTSLGVAAPASWTFAALSAPVYLIARAGALRRETGNGGPALIVWLICFVLAIAGFVGYGFIGGSPLVPGLPS